MSEKPSPVRLVEKYISYVGLSDARVIRSSDWSVLGIQGPNFRWSKENNFRIKITDDLPREVLEYFEKDRELVITEE